MAQEREAVYVSYEASTDLSTYQFRLMKLDANGRLALATATDDDLIGVLANKPDALGVAAKLCIGGVHRVKASAAFNEGDRISTDGNGFAAALTTDTKTYVGTAMTAPGASLDIFEMLVTPMAMYAG